MKTLWDHQTRAIDGCQEQWRQRKRRVCLVQPTGSGKTITAMEIIRRTIAKERTATFAQRAIVPKRTTGRCTAFRRTVRAGRERSAARRHLRSRRHRQVQPGRLGPGPSVF